MRSLTPILSVKEIERSLRFYIEVLGFEQWFCLRAKDGSVAVAGVRRGNSQFIFGNQEHLSEIDRRGLGAGVELYVDVGEDDIDAWYEMIRLQISDLVRPIETKCWGDRVFTILDPAGYRLSFAKTIEQLSLQEISERIVQPA